MNVGQEINVKDKLIKPKQQPRFQKHHAQTDNIVTSRNKNNSKSHKSNVKILISNPHKFQDRRINFRNRIDTNPLCRTKSPSRRN